MNTIMNFFWNKYSPSQNHAKMKYNWQNKWLFFFELLKMFIDFGNRDALTWGVREFFSTVKCL